MYIYIHIHMCVHVFHEIPIKSPQVLLFTPQEIPEISRWTPQGGGRVAFSPVSSISLLQATGEVLGIEPRWMGG